MLKRCTAVVGGAQRPEGPLWGRWTESYRAESRSHHPIAAIAGPALGWHPLLFSEQTFLPRTS